MLSFLYLSFPYITSYSTTAHFLLACSFSLHHNTIGQSMISPLPECPAIFHAGFACDIGSCVYGGSRCSKGYCSNETTDGLISNRGLLGWSRIRCFVCGASSGNIIHGTIIGSGNDIFGVSNGFGCGYRDSMLEPSPAAGTEPMSCTGTVLKRKLHSFLGLCIYLLVLLEVPLGYIFTVSTILLFLLFSGFKAHLIKRWKTRKGGLFQPGKETSELENVFRASGGESKQVFWRTAGISSKKIPFLSVMHSISAAFLILAVVLGDCGKRNSGLDVDAGTWSGSWVGSNGRGDQWHQYWGCSRYVVGRHGGGGRLDIYVGTAGNGIESTHQAQRAGGGLGGSGGSGGGGSGGGGGGDGDSDYYGSGNTDTDHGQADRSNNRCRKERSNCRGKGSSNSGVQTHVRIGASKGGKNGHDSDNLRGAVERKGGREAGRVEHDRSWTVISDRSTVGVFVDLRLLQRGGKLGFDKDNPRSHEQETVRIQQQDRKACCM
jgi:hypothetical protein